MLRVTAHGWLLEAPEDRPKHGDVVATLAVPDASRSLGAHVMAHFRATNEMAKDALRKKKRGDWVTIMGAARFSEVAGRTRGFEKFVLNLDADMVVSEEALSEQRRNSSSAGKRIL